MGITKDSNFRFGITEAMEPGSQGTGAKNALTMDTDGTRIVKRTSQDYQMVAHDHLGTSKNLMQGTPQHPPEHAFGIKTCTDMSAGELIRGFYLPEEQLPDQDLGSCTVPGRRNFASPHTFGVPTVRTDVVAPSIQKRSVVNTTNYGDDHDAVSLISPDRFGVRGVSDDVFDLRRTR